MEKRRIRLMTRLAIYEKKYGRSDEKIATYYQKDYLRVHTLLGIFWGTVGYGVLMGLLMMLDSSVFLDKLSFMGLLAIFVLFVVGYFLCVIAYVTFVRYVCQEKYGIAKHRIKRYYRGLSRLEKMRARKKERGEA